MYATELLVTAAPFRFILVTTGVLCALIHFVGWDWLIHVKWRFCSWLPVHFLHRCGRFLRMALSLPCQSQSWYWRATPSVLASSHGTQQHATSFLVQVRALCVSWNLQNNAAETQIEPESSSRTALLLTFTSLSRQVATTRSSSGTWAQVRLWLPWRTCTLMSFTACAGTATVALSAPPARTRLSVSSTLARRWLSL